MSTRLSGGREYTATRAVFDIKIKDAAGETLLSAECRAFALTFRAGGKPFSMSRQEWDMFCNDINIMMGWGPGDA